MPITTPAAVPEDVIVAALVVGELNLSSVAFMVLFFGLGVDFGTHVGLRYLEDVKAGGTPDAALKALKP